jgi:predicted small secreted protein
MKKLIRLVVLLMLATFTAAALHGCHTMGGLGKDLEKGGQKLQDAADR